MGLLRWLGFGKKEGPEEGSGPPGQTASEVNTGQSDDMDIVVYSSRDATRCASVRDLLERNNYPFRDVRVDDDMSCWFVEGRFVDGCSEKTVAMRDSHVLEYLWQE